MSTVIELQAIYKSYRLGQQHLPVLNGIDIVVEKGELLSIMGASGSGKSTLMNIIGLLDHADKGHYRLEGKEVLNYSDIELAHIRNRTIGFVFQSFFLLPRLTALQNVGLPLSYRNMSSKDIHHQSLATLNKVGMDAYYNRKPNELSGGQMQRVAIARAMVGQPSVLLADEPTGALDSKTGQEVMDLFIDLNQRDKTTIIIITHDEMIAKQCKRIIHIKDGVIV